MLVAAGEAQVDSLDDDSHKCLELFPDTAAPYYCSLCFPEAEIPKFGANKQAACNIISALVSLLY